MLKIASTGKDPVSGKHVTHEYRVEGPVMIFLTTTAHEVDEELLNRCLVLTVNEEREQTQAIHRKQREAQTLEGTVGAATSASEILALHRNAQRLLRPLRVVNPNQPRGADLPDSHDAHAARSHEVPDADPRHRAVAPAPAGDQDRRAHGETLEYIEATRSGRKAGQAAGQRSAGPSLDELPPQTRRLLTLIDEMVRQECERLRDRTRRVSFHAARRCASTRWGDTQLRMHLRRLEEMEYLVLRHGGGQGQQLRLPAAFDVEMPTASRSCWVFLIFAGSEGNFAGGEGHFAGSSRPLAGGSRGCAG